jgi:myo-inositol-1(or 4)-monophosphatase
VTAALPPDTEDALEFAVRLVADCGAYADAQQQGVAELTKSATLPLQGSVVTAVDVEVERRVDAALAERFGDDALVGEEYADRAGTSGRTWQVDPVDGTLNYARRLGPWSVVLSAWSGQECDLVAVFTQGAVYSAVRGHGAWRDGARLALDPGAAEAGGIVRVPSLLAAAAYEAGWLPRSIDSSATELCEIADGRTVGAVRLGGHPRDLHGPALLVQEAGGTVTDLSGGGWTASTRGMVLAAPGAHAAVLALARRAQP